MVLLRRSRSESSIEEDSEPSIDPEVQQIFEEFDSISFPSMDFEPPPEKTLKERILKQHRARVEAIKAHEKKFATESCVPDVIFFRQNERDFDAYEEDTAIRSDIFREDEESLERIDEPEPYLNLLNHSGSNFEDLHEPRRKVQWNKTTLEGFERNNLILNKALAEKKIARIPNAKRRFEKLARVELRLERLDREEAEELGLDSEEEDPFGHFHLLPQTFTKSEKDPNERKRDVFERYIDLLHDFDYEKRSGNDEKKEFAELHERKETLEMFLDHPSLDRIPRGGSRYASRTKFRISDVSDSGCSLDDIPSTSTPTFRNEENGYISDSSAVEEPPTSSISLTTQQSNDDMDVSIEIIEPPYTVEFAPIAPPKETLKRKIVDGIDSEVVPKKIDQDHRLSSESIKDKRLSTEDAEKTRKSDQNVELVRKERERRMIATQKAEEEALEKQKKEKELQEILEKKRVEEKEEAEKLKVQLLNDQTSDTHGIKLNDVEMFKYLTAEVIRISEEVLKARFYPEAENNYELCDVYIQGLMEISQLSRNKQNHFPNSECFHMALDILIDHRARVTEKEISQKTRATIESMKFMMEHGNQCVEKKRAEEKEEAEKLKAQLQRDAEKLRIEAERKRRAEEEERRKKEAEEEERRKKEEHEHEIRRLQEEIQRQQRVVNMQIAAAVPVETKPVKSVVELSDKWIFMKCKIPKERMKERKDKFFSHFQCPPNEAHRQLEKAAEWTQFIETAHTKVIIIPQENNAKTKVIPLTRPIRVHAAPPPPPPVIPQEPPVPVKPELKIARCQDIEKVLGEVKMLLAPTRKALAARIPIYEKEIDYQSCYLDKLKMCIQYPFKQSDGMYWPVVFLLKEPGGVPLHVVSLTKCLSFSGKFASITLLTASLEDEARKNQQKFESSYAESAGDWAEYSQKPGRFSNRIGFKAHRNKCKDTFDIQRGRAKKRMATQFAEELEEDNTFKNSFNEYKERKDRKKYKQNFTIHLATLVRDARLDVYSLRETFKEFGVMDHPGTRDSPLDIWWYSHGYRHYLNTRDREYGYFMARACKRYERLLPYRSDRDWYDKFNEWCCQPMLASLYYQLKYKKTALEICRLNDFYKKQWTILNDQLAAQFKDFYVVISLVHDQTTSNNRRFLCSFV